MISDASTKGALPEASVVSVRLLGGLRLTTAGATLDGSELGRRAQLALARLAFDGTDDVSRDRLADAVWGSSLPASWRESLRNVISELRRALERSGLSASASLATSAFGYALHLPPGSTVDVALLRARAEEASRALRAGELATALEQAERALTLAGSPVLPGLSADWVEGVRDEVSELRMRLGLGAGEAALGLGDPARTERLARALIEMAPLREEAHRLLIRALRDAGNRAQALVAYDDCRRRLSRELGALPAPATQELFLEILAEERAEQPLSHVRENRLPVAASLAQLARLTPFVGRESLLHRLRRRMEMVSDAGTFVVCVRGEPGIGKTRLAAELAVRFRRDGRGVLYGRAHDRLSLPYAALVDALERGLPSVDRRELELRLGDDLATLATLLPSLDAGDAPTDGIWPVAPEAVRRAIVAGLRVLAGEDGALLILDDMQWAAQTELEVVQELLADPERTRLLVLVLHRDPLDDAGLPVLGSHPRIARRELEPLSVEEIARLQEHSGERQHDARELWRSSGGNPLLATALLRSPSGGRLTRSLDELVGERLRALPDGAETVLSVAAVAGPEFDPGLVGEASGVTPPQAADVFEAARAARLLVAADDGGGGRLAFRHGLIRDALLRGLGDTERARLHRRLGVRLETDSPTHPASLVDLAYHFASAAPLGDWRRALHYGAPVARQAYDAGVYEDVIGLTARALEALSQAGDPDPPARLELEILLGGAQRALGDPRGPETLERAFADARARGDAAGMADAALALTPVGAVSVGLFLDDRQITHYESALAALGDADTGRRARLLARLAGAYGWRRSRSAGRPAAQQALALARELDDERTLTLVLAGVRHSLIGSADVAGLQSLEAELEQLADRAPDASLRVSVALWRYATAVQSGDGTGLEALLADAGEHARGLAIGSLHHALAFEHAALALLRGRVAEAEQLVARAARIGHEHRLDAGVVESVRLTQMMLVRGEQQRLGELRDEAAPVFGSGAVTTWLGAMAVIDAAGGTLSAVAERLDAVLDEYEQNGPTVICSGAVIAYFAATVVRLEQPARARRMRELILPLAGQGAYFAGFAGPIDYHLGLLERHLGDEAAARRRLAAAVSFCARLGAPRWQARCEEALAEAGCG